MFVANESGWNKQSWNEMDMTNKNSMSSLHLPSFLCCPYIAIPFSPFLPHHQDLTKPPLRYASRVSPGPVKHWNRLRLSSSPTSIEAIADRGRSREKKRNAGNA